MRANDTAKVVNCAIFGNFATSDGTGRMHVWDGKAECFVNCVGEVAPNTTCRAAASGFVSTDGGNPRLLVSSACRDAGADYTTSGAVSATDLDGNPRVSGTAVDAGCYEYQDTGAFDVAFESSVRNVLVDTPVTFTVTALNAVGACSYGWDFDGDGTDDVTSGEPTAVWTFDTTTCGERAVRLTVSDSTTTRQMTRTGVIFVAPKVLYGDPANAANAEYPFDTPAKAGVDLQQVVAAARSGSVILLADGTYSLEKELVLEHDIQMRSLSAVPAQCVLNMTKKMGWDFSFYSRVVRLNSAGAFISGLTLQNGYGIQANGSGADLMIDGAGGTASNCVLSAGQAINYSGEGGGAYLKNGLLTGCLIQNCDCENGFDQGVASALCVAGGTAENCLILTNGFRMANSGNAVTVRNGGKLLNCTVVGNRIQSGGKGKSDDARAGISVDAKSTVVNCVSAGNVSDGVDSGDVAWCGTATAFVNCATDASEQPGETSVFADAGAFRDFAAYDLRPAAGGPLVNAGSESVTSSSVDLNGNPRLVGLRIDIGCYEAGVKGLTIILR